MALLPGQEYKVLYYLNKNFVLSCHRLLINIKQREVRFTLDRSSIILYAVYFMQCLKTIYSGTKLFL